MKRTYDGRVYRLPNTYIWKKIVFVKETWFHSNLQEFRRAQNFNLHLMENSKKLIYHIRLNIENQYLCSCVYALLEDQMTFAAFFRYIKLLEGPID